VASIELIYQPINFKVQKTFDPILTQIKFSELILTEITTK